MEFLKKFVSYLDLIVYKNNNWIFEQVDEYSCLKVRWNFLLNIITQSMDCSNALFDWFMQVISKELKKDEFKENILKPLVKSLISYIMPYLFFVMGIHVFIIILAFILVFYFVPKKNM